MELVKTEKGDVFPIKAMPEETRAKKVLELGIWLSKLLSLKDETSAERLEVLLPMVSDYCWSMTIEDIKKAFTKYVKGELPKLEPKTNFLDVILFGKVISSYKQSRPPIKPKTELPRISESEKENLIYMGLVNCFDSYLQDKKVIAGYTWVYDHIDELDLISFSNEEKLSKMKRAKIVLKQQANESNNIFTVKNAIMDIESKNSASVINESKRMLLVDYFERLIKQKKHLKDLLK